MDGSGHRDLGDIRRWKTLPPAAVGPSSSAHLGSDESGLLGWLASGSRALEKAAVEPAWAVDEFGLATAMALLGQLRSLTDRLEISVTAEVLTPRHRPGDRAVGGGLDRRPARHRRPAAGPAPGRRRGAGRRDHDRPGARRPGDR
jgi:hypothetical protein